MYEQGMRVLAVAVLHTVLVVSVNNTLCATQPCLVGVVCVCHMSGTDMFCRGGTGLA